MIFGDLQIGLPLFPFSMLFIARLLKDSCVPSLILVSLVPGAIEDLVSTCSMRASAQPALWARLVPH